MPRDSEGWKREREDALRSEVWTLTGPRRLVKIVEPERQITHATGYITVGISLVGKTPLQIATAVGIPVHKYFNGALIYMLRRMPGPSEVEYELTAKMPDGLHYVEGMSHPDYPPGDPTIHQWRLGSGVKIPVLKTPLKLKPSQRFVYNDLYL